MYLSWSFQRHSWVLQECISSVSFSTWLWSHELCWKQRFGVSNALCSSSFKNTILSLHIKENGNQERESVFQVYEGLIKFNLESALTLQNYINNLLHCQLKAVNMYMLSQKNSILEVQFMSNWKFLSILSQTLIGKFGKI